MKLPLIKKTYPQLIANKITAVQPLLGPTGLVYYLRHRYQHQEEVVMRKKKKYRSIDDTWEI